ncbi:hypothetical protein C2W62_20270 [Candidatus Entotheonella serta]|nr:hypothetical protein C2W62_20270 [Candidatus Entotheonella serta]
MDDDGLIRQIAMGDRTAFGTLYRCYAPHLLGYLQAQIGQRDIAEEVCHDVLLVVWQKAAQVQTAVCFSAWIFGIATRLACEACAHRAIWAADMDRSIEEWPCMDDPAEACERPEEM